MANTANFDWPLPSPAGIQITEIEKIATSLIAIDVQLKQTETALSSHKHSFDELLDIPSTLEGYGITDGMTATEIRAAIKKAVDDLVNGSGAALDTLKELADALGNDANFSATVSAALSLRVRVDAAQTFSLAQKTQGRANLDALGTVDKGKENGVAPLGGDGKIPTQYLPGDLTSTVLTSAQTLTAQQKGQALANIDAGFMAEFRNRFINPCHDIVQRAATVTLVAGAAVIVSDRWWVLNSTNQSCTVAVQRAAMGSTLSPSGGNYLSVYFATAPTTGTVEVLQKVEDVETLAGQLATMTAFIRGQDGVVLTPFVEQVFGTGGGASTSVKTSGTTGTFATATTRRKISSLIDIPSVVGKVRGTDGKDHLRAGFSFAPRTATTFMFDDLSLVKGDARAEENPTAPRHIGQELALCQRYYERGEYFWRNDGTLGSSSVTVGDNVRFTAVKRATPSVSIAATTNLNAIAPSVTDLSASTISLVWAWTSGSSGTTRNIIGTWTADAEI